MFESTKLILPQISSVELQVRRKLFFSVCKLFASNSSNVYYSIDIETSPTLDVCIDRYEKTKKIIMMKPSMDIFES